MADFHTKLGFPYIEVNLDQIRENLFHICSKTQKDTSQVIAVVKDNCYGLGAKYISNLLQNEGVKHFAVATTDEAIFLRKNGITADILVIGNVEVCDFELAEQHKLTLSIVDATQLKYIQKARKIKWHINIDTGMHRNGILYEDIITNTELINEIKAISPFISGVYTHYYSSDDEDQASVKLQQEKFKKAVFVLQNEGLKFDIIHTSNSGAVSYSDIAENEFIRPGVLLYGCRPDPSRDPQILVKEAIKIKSKITGIRKIKAGEGVSYGHKWIADKDTQIATIPIGYADGFPRLSLLPTATVAPSFLVEGTSDIFLAVGRVTMDYIMLDIGDNPTVGSVPQVKIGDIVILSDSIDELALKAGTIGYELLCKFGGLMNRKYLEDNVVVASSTRELY